MAAGPITSWQINGETMEIEKLFSWAPKSLQMVSAAMKLRCLFLGRKAMTNLDSILRSKDITLPAKVCIVKVTVLLVMCGCESWTIKKVVHRIIDACELWTWRRLSKVSWTAGRSNQLILEEINPEYSLEGLMPKLKLQYFGHLMGRANSSEKTLMLGRLKAGGEGDNRGWDGWMTSLTQWTWVWASSGRWGGTGKPGVLQSMGLQTLGHDLSKWTIALSHYFMTCNKLPSQVPWGLGQNLIYLYS